MKGIHVVIGDDSFLVAEAAMKIAGGAEGVETIDSAQSTNAELQLRDIAAADESFSTPPFLEPRKTTWWRNVDFLPQPGRGGPSADVKAALERFAAKIASSPLPENQRFILSGARLLDSSTFAKTLKGVAEFAVFASAKPRQRVQDATVRAIDFAKEAGLEFEPGAADAFVARVGVDSRTMASELAKLRDYVGGGGAKISAADIAEIASAGPGTEPSAWDVTDAIGERDARRLMAAIRPLQDSDSFAIVVCGMVERFLRTLAGMKDAEARGTLSEATAGMAPFVVRKNVAFLRGWTLNELRVARARILALRERAVTSGGGQNPLAVAELLRMCRAPARRRPA